MAGEVIWSFTPIIFQYIIVLYPLKLMLPIGISNLIISW